MLNRVQAKEILQMLQMLPADKVAEVVDYVTFLRERYARKKPANFSEAWSDEDLSDVIAASLAHAEQTMWAGES